MEELIKKKWEIDKITISSLILGYTFTVEEDGKILFLQTSLLSIQANSYSNCFLFDLIHLYIDNYFNFKYFKLYLDKIIKKVILLY